MIPSAMLFVSDLKNILGENKEISCLLQQKRIRDLDLTVINTSGWIRKRTAICLGTETTQEEIK